MKTVVRNNVSNLVKIRQTKLLKKQQWFKNSIYVYLLFYYHYVICNKKIVKLMFAFLV